MDILIELEEFCSIMHCKLTKGRALLRTQPYGIKIGGTWYAHRKKLETWIEHNCNGGKKVI